MWPFFIIVILLTFNASANNKESPPIYLRVDIGASFPSGSFYKNDKNYYYKGSTIDRTWFGGVGIGYIFNNNIRTDLVLTNRNLYTFSKSEHQDTDLVSTKQNFSNTSLITNLYYDFTNTTIIIPYINFGVGVSRNRNGSYNKYYNDEKLITATSGIKYDFAWNAGIGLQAKLTQNFYADLFFKYVDLGKFKNNSYALVTEINEISNPGLIENKEVGLSLIYKF